MRRYIHPNTNIVTKFISDTKDTAVNYIFFPVALFLGVMTLFALVLIAFGKVDFWGLQGQIAVGIFVPLIIILCFNRSIGNFIFRIWMSFLLLIFYIIPILIIIYVCLKPSWEYLGL